MKKAHFASIFLLIFILSCNDPFLKIETGSNSKYSILGYFTKDVVKVELLLNSNFNENIDLLNKKDNVTAQVFIIDSLNQQEILVPYDVNKSYYFVEGLNLERSNKYRLEVRSNDLNAKTKFVQLPNSLELIEFSKDKENIKNTLSVKAIFTWNPKEDECIESFAYNVENKKLFVTPLDYIDISQCYNKFTFTSVYFRNCYYTGDKTTIRQAVGLQLTLNGGSYIPVKKVIFAACSKEYTEFINSIYFIEDFERAFVYTGIIHSNIISENATGYFYGRDEIIIEF